VKLELPKIYPITDAAISGLSHVEQVKKLIDGGARIIQLREKHASPRDFFESAARAIQFARRSEVRIIINDRVDIALALKADGVHLGQDDMPPDKAREILGPDAIIGFSTHSVKQASAAIALPVDYIAIGPIFETLTKEDSDDVVGLGGLGQVRAAVPDLPLVAIGGITLENINAVLAAGANSAAIIGAIISNPARIESRLLQFIDQTS
jgi:thiamine-phosphate pyrophosphorylase